MVTKILANSSTANFLSSLNQNLSKSIYPSSQIILAGATTALIAMGVHRWINATKQGPQNKQFEIVKARVNHAFAYVFAGFGFTATFGAWWVVSGVSLSLLLHAPIMLPLAGIFSIIAAHVALKTQDIKMKHLAWLAFHASMGLMLSPLAFFGKELMIQAGAISLCLGSLMILSSMMAPDKKFLKWEGPLMAALTSLCIVSSVALFFPQTAFSYGVDQVSLYGGLVLFSLLLGYDTQKLVERAETQDENTFSPLDASLDIYMDVVNIFVRVLAILSKDKKEPIKN